MSQSRTCSLIRTEIIDHLLAGLRGQLEAADFEVELRHGLTKVMDNAGNVVDYRIGSLNDNGAWVGNNTFTFHISGGAHGKKTSHTLAVPLGGWPDHPKTQTVKLLYPAGTSLVEDARS